MAWLPSIRWRIQAWHAFLLALVTLGLLVFVFLYAREAEVARVDMELTGDVVRLMPFHVPIPGFKDPPGKAEGSARPAPPFPGGIGPGHIEKILESAGKYIVVYRPDGSVSYRSPGAPAEAPLPANAKEGNTPRWNGPNREVVHRSPRGMVMIVGKPGTVLHRDLGLFACKLALLGLAVVGLGVAIGSWLFGAALRPIREIAATARRIAAGAWEKRIPSTGGASELRDLAVVLNESFDRISTNYQHQARFTADASHELGNPVSIILSETEFALDRPRSAEEYINSLQACRRAGERMNALTRDLLDLASYESGQAVRRRAACDLAELIREALAAVEHFAAEKHAVMKEDLQPVTAQVDAASLGQALINLLGNAIKHNEEGVRVCVRLWQEDGLARIEVSDSGRGIPSEALPHLFERFYRAHSGSKGHGLGLAVTKAIIEANQGTIRAESPAAGGARFLISLPLN